jgi:hypothetical protein
VSWPRDGFARSIAQLGAGSLMQPLRGALRSPCPVRRGSETAAHHGAYTRRAGVALQRRGECTVLSQRDRVDEIAGLNSAAGDPNVDSPARMCHRPAGTRWTPALWSTSPR